MAKRFTDNEKWKKRFFKSLSTVNKLFFLYILDECDNAGIWHVELEIAEPRIGEKLNLESAKKELGKHIFEFDDGEKWFIPFFIDFQYGSLNPSVNAHKSVIDKLEKRGLTKIYEQFINSSRTDLDKDKDMDKDKVKDKEEWTIQKLWIKTFGRNPNLPEAEETQKIVDKFGYGKAYLIMKQATLDGFKKIKTLANSLDDSGNIKPRTIAGERPPQPIKEKYCFCGKEAVIWSDGIAGCSYVHCLEGKKLKK